MPATRTISTTIALNGEAAYRRSMEEINRSLRTLKAETQAAAAAFQSEGRTMQSLTSYQQRLQAQYDQLIVKQESLKQAVRDASRIYGDNSKEADRHRAALANVEAEMNRLQGEMNRTETELQELRQAEQGAADGANDMAGGMQGAAQSMGVSTIAIGNMLADLARRAARFLADAAKAGIEYNAEMQSYTQALTNSLGSAEAAAAGAPALPSTPCPRRSPLRAAATTSCSAWPRICSRSRTWARPAPWISSSFRWPVSTSTASWLTTQVKPCKRYRI